MLLSIFTAVFAAMAAFTPIVYAMWRLALRVSVLEFQVAQAKLPEIGTNLTMLLTDVRWMREQLERIASK